MAIMPFIEGFGCGHDRIGSDEKILDPRSNSFPNRKGITSSGFKIVLPSGYMAHDVVLYARYSPRDSTPPKIWHVGNKYPASASDTNCLYSQSQEVGE